jgi:acyl carrier protein
MQREEILSALRQIAVDVLGSEPDSVTESASFKDDLDADSLDLVEVVMAVEERFDIAIPEEDLATLGTVGQAIDVVMAKQAVGA